MYKKIIILIYLSVTLEATDNFHKKYFFLDKEYEAYEIDNNYFVEKMSLKKENKKAFSVTYYYSNTKPLDKESIETIREYPYDDLEVGGLSRALCFISHKKNIIYIQTSIKLAIYNIKNPSNPIELAVKESHLNDPGYNSSYMFVSFLLDKDESYWYGSLNDNTFHILDISNPKKIKFVFNHKLGLPIEEIFLSKNEKYVAVQVSSEKTRVLSKSFFYIYKLDKYKQATLIKIIKDKREYINASFCNNDKDICVNTNIKDIVHYVIQNNTAYITKSLYSFCKATGIKESEIRALNPWINKEATNIPTDAEIFFPILDREENK